MLYILNNYYHSILIWHFVQLFSDNTLSGDKMKELTITVDSLVTKFRSYSVRVYPYKGDGNLIVRVGTNSVTSYLRVPAVQTLF